MSTISTPNSVHPTRPSLLPDAAAAADDDDDDDAGRLSLSRSPVDRLYT